MNGPAAPKDPEKKRPYFYIMKDKEIFGAKQEDGSAIHFIYESDGRLINSAQIVGNITDENMLRLLETVEGFGKLVHSIGVSVETDNPKEEMEFIFQMYGKKDLYGGGTNLRCSLTGDGMERRIYLSDYTWTEDDYIPGQIKFIMSVPEKMGKASVRFYLNDGYTAPEEVEEEAVDTKSELYCTMIERSLMNLGNTYRIRKAIEKARAGKEVTLAYIGGSITQGAGATPINTACYAYKSYQLFKSRFAMRDNVKFVKAGVGGTPSELGMLRFDRDVLRDGEKPDIVVVEFAVNDEGDETKGDCYESLVRKILKLDWNQAADIHGGSEKINRSGRTGGTGRKGTVFGLFRVPGQLRKAWRCAESVHCRHSGTADVQRHYQQLCAADRGLFVHFRGERRTEHPAERKCADADRAGGQGVHQQYQGLCGTTPGTPETGSVPDPIYRHSDRGYRGDRRRRAEHFCPAQAQV